MTTKTPLYYCKGIPLYLPPYPALTENLSLPILDLQIRIKAMKQPIRFSRK
ncbi:OLC1v1032658C1 [Oldenlandia corymbosa var. corymbosa]|uniref:OLC1v1032658C1 n=1 Tax=Oldenlandia corymbosa var. corymbosa TaxID=529605 RepID=A0AAV1CM96_OLDCO|nr:OLC1v1032658C1 [Oldenlandia corymbosa var. corymbosa]